MGHGLISRPCLIELETEEPTERSFFHPCLYGVIALHRPPPRHRAKRDRWLRGTPVRMGIKKDQNACLAEIKPITLQTWV